MRRRTSLSPFLVLFALSSSIGCSGNGCSCMAPIPGGFPAADRNANAAQVRVSSTGLDAITADPAALIAALTGGPLAFDVPDSCGGTPALCCPGGTAQSPCGPINIDLTEVQGDDARMTITPQAGASALDVVVRARVTTGSPLPISLFGLDCELVLDTTAIDNANGDPYPDIEIDAPVTLTQDATAGTTRVDVGTVAVQRFTNDDFAIQEVGGPAFPFLCEGLNWGAQQATGTLAQTFADQIKNAIQSQTCKACPSGDVAECGPFADACTNNVCMEGSACLQELGVEGRMAGASLLGGFSPGTGGAMDLYEVAGGYATTDQGGIALGMLGGMDPAGTPHDLCGPPTTAPTPVQVPQSTFFQGNSRPDTGAPFDIAFGVHQSQLDQFAYAGYNGGILCLTIDSDTVSLLNTGEFSLFLPSLGDLAPEPKPMAIGLRPQSPPVITLGLNTFIDDGNGNVSVDDPLLHVHFSGMELDFFAAIEDQYVRLFTLVTDVDLPIGLQVGSDGALTPVLGDVSDAFSNISVKNSEPLKETPQELTDIFPTILGLALGQLGTLGSFQVPTVGGLNIHVTDITAVDNLSFLAIFGTLMTPQMAERPRVDTTATIASIDLPDEAVFHDPSRWRDERPRVHLALGGSESDLEWSVRVDDGWWSAWSKHPDETIAPDTFLVEGPHQVEVRARRIGDSYSTDLTPVVLGTTIGNAMANTRTVPHDFHGAPSGSGCGCQSSSGGGAGGLVLIAIVMIGLRKRRGAIKRFGFVLLAALMPACNCGNSAPCGDVACMPGEVARGPVGRWNSVASDGNRTVVTTYDQKLGDLVLLDVVSGSDPVYTVVDGVPDETPTFDPGTYRGGIATAGEDVGAWSSVALEDGFARVSYQDRDQQDLKFAIEDSAGWQSYMIDGDDASDIGVHSALGLDGNGAPVIAYLAVGVADGTGRKTDLRLARASTKTPDDASAWTITTVASAPISCAGLCGDQTCVAAADLTQSCATATTDCTTACASTETCVAGTCETTVADPVATDIPGGTGLWPSVLTFSDGRLALVYYDRVRTALVLQVEASVGSSTFTETVLDGADDADRGMWATAVTDGTTIYTAYQDARSDELYYVTWNGSAGTPELVDDGIRTGDRPHNVGAGATIFLDGGAPKIAYQDGLSSNLVLATKNGTWSHEDIASGDILDGFHVAATSTGPWLVWGNLDKTRVPLRDLEIREMP